jgi:hypothetical protein
MIRITRCRSTRQNEDRNAGHGNEAGRMTVSVSNRQTSRDSSYWLNEFLQVATSLG